LSFKHGPQEVTLIAQDATRILRITKSRLAFGIIGDTAAVALARKPLIAHEVERGRLVMPSKTSLATAFFYYPTETRPRNEVRVFWIEFCVRCPKGVLGK
jgi:hypothetical protein